jgi:hypothetical protein
VAGTTGDIIWRRTDPKTVELYNVDRGPRAAPSAQEESQKALERTRGETILSATGKASSDAERAALYPGEDIPQYAFPRRTEPLTKEEKKEHREVLKGFMKAWKMGDPTEFDPVDAMEELLAGGYATYDEDGVGTPLGMYMSKKDKERFIWAADAWADRVGAWKDGQYDPEAPVRYWEDQRRRFEQEYP